MAKAKLDAKGKCICTHPYTGKLCEECATGFHPHDEELDIDIVRQETHVVCIPEHESNEFMCNGFGTYDALKK